MSVSVRSNARQIAERNLERSGRVRVNLTRAINESRSIKGSAVFFSSGTHKQAEFDAAPGRGPHANNPYGYGTSNSRGARGSIPYGDPGTINIQSGQLAAGWQIEIQFTNTSISLILFNKTNHAKLIAAANRGATKMRPRPILENIHREEDAAFFRRFSKALSDALR